MAVVASSGNTSVTGNVDVTSQPGFASLASNQTIVNVAGVGNGSVKADYTVTTGKSFYLMGISQEVGVAGDQIIVYKNDGSTPVLYNNCGTGSVNVTPVTPIWIYQSGEVVNVKCANNRHYTFWGFEQ